MTRRQPKLPQGDYRTPTGYRVSIHRNDTRTYRRFPPTAKPAEMVAWRDEEKVRLRKLRVPVRAGTLRADVVRYLHAVATMPTLADNQTRA